MTTLQRPVGSVFQVAFSPSGRYLAAVGQKGVHLWDRHAGTSMGVGPLPARKMHEGLAFSPDESTVAVSRGDDVYLYDTATGQEQRHFPWPGHGLAFSPAGRILAICGGAAVRLVGLDDGREVARLTGHDGPVASLAFAPDGRSLATTGADRTIRLWDVDRGAELLVLRGHTGRVSCVGFHPNGRLLVTGSEQPGEIKIWDATARHQEFVKLPNAAGHALAFTADGRGVVQRYRQ